MKARGTSDALTTRCTARPEGRGDHLGNQVAALPIGTAHHQSDVNLRAISPPCRCVAARGDAVLVAVAGGAAPEAEGEVAAVAARAAAPAAPDGADLHLCETPPPSPLVGGTPLPHPTPPLSRRTCASRPGLRGAAAPGEAGGAGLGRRLRLPALHGPLRPHRRCHRSRGRLRRRLAAARHGDAADDERCGPPRQRGGSARGAAAVRGRRWSGRTVACRPGLQGLHRLSGGQLLVHDGL